MTAYQESILANNSHTEQAIESLKEALRQLDEQRLKIAAALEDLGYKVEAARSTTYAGLKASRAILLYLEKHGPKADVGAMIRELLDNGFGIRTKNPAREIKKSLGLFEDHYWSVKRQGPRRNPKEVVEADVITLLPIAERKQLKRRKKRK